MFHWDLVDPGINLGKQKLTNRLLGFFSRLSPKCSSNIWPIMFNYSGCRRSTWAVWQRLNVNREHFHFGVNSNPPKKCWTTSCLSNNDTSFVQFFAPHPPLQWQSSQQKNQSTSVSRFSPKVNGSALNKYFRSIIFDLEPVWLMIHAFANMWNK